MARALLLPVPLGLPFPTSLKEARYLLTQTVADKQGGRKKGDDATVGRKLECLALPLKNCHWALKRGLCDSTGSQIMWSVVRGNLSQL